MSEFFEVTHTDQTRTSCDGGGGAAGHPLVYLDMSKDGSVTCPYCSRHFVLTKAA